VKKLLVIVATTAVMAIGVVCAPSASAQQPEAPAKVKQNIPLELQVIVSRYQGEKRISSLPYVLSLKSAAVAIGFRGPSQGASLRLGSRVPIRQQVVVPAQDGKPATTTSSVTYENVGMNIDASASALEDGRFELTLTINESSVTDPADLKNALDPGGNPVFRSYQSTNTLFIKDGQTTQFTAATDRVSGEVVRVEVKLTVVK
jgi:hypothetical protein